MNQNKFFIVEADNTPGQALKIMPTEYLEELHPHQAIAELQEYIETLETAMEQYEGQPMPMNVGRIGSLAFELELVRSFLRSFRETYGTMH
jgi:hypothetical protein